MSACQQCEQQRDLENGAGLAHYHVSMSAIICQHVSNTMSACQQCQQFKQARDLESGAGLALLATHAILCQQCQQYCVRNISMSAMLCQQKRDLENCPGLALLAARNQLAKEHDDRQRVRHQHHLRGVGGLTGVPRS